MSAKRLRSYRFGDTDERMAEAMLSLISFTTSVRREDDLGHDFICVLAEREGDYLQAGPSFTVQVKSHTQRDQLVFSKPHEVNWLQTQQTPYFIGLTYRHEQRLDLYSTWNIHNSYLWKEASCYQLDPGGDQDQCELPFPREEPECRKKQTIPLGKPILRFTFTDLLDEESLQRFRNILKEWILLERENLVRRNLKLHWIYGPKRYNTNRSPFEPESEFRATVYWNAVNINECLRNFTRAATSLRNTMNRVEPAESSYKADWDSLVLALDAALNAFSDHLEPPAQSALEQELGKRFPANHTT